MVGGKVYTFFEVYVLVALTSAKLRTYAHIPYATKKKAEYSIIDYISCFFLRISRGRMFGRCLSIVTLYIHTTSVPFVGTLAAWVCGRVQVLGVFLSVSGVLARRPVWRGADDLRGVAC